MISAGQSSLAGSIISLHYARAAQRFFIAILAPSGLLPSGHASVWPITRSDTNPTPTQIRAELFGQNMFAQAVGRASIKISGKIKFAESRPRLVRDFIGGANNSLMNAGQPLVHNNEADNVPGSSTYTITVTNAAIFALDLGVIYQATGEPLTRVSRCKY
jgi:hypothetical protein